MAYESKRFTPKKSDLPAVGAGTGKASDLANKAVEAAEEKLSGRYTPKTTRATPTAELPESPAWVAWLMFALFGLGLLAIVINYTNIFWKANNNALFAGLGFIIAGFITATRLR